MNFSRLFPFPLDDASLRVWAVILFAALVTYGMRLGGLLLAERMPDTGRFRRFMDALPGAILLSLVAPGAVAAGPAGCLGAGVTAILARRTGNLFLSMIAGVLIVAASRHTNILMSLFA